MKEAAGGTGQKGIDMEKLKRLSMQSRPTAWSVRRLVSYVRSSGLSTISRTVDDFGTAGSEITSEWEARNCAKRIFKHVAKPGAKLVYYSITWSFIFNLLSPINHIIRG